MAMAQVQSLVRELKSCKSCGVAQKNKGTAVNLMVIVKGPELVGRKGRGCTSGVIRKGFREDGAFDL